MSDVYTIHEGSLPLLISVPHDGWQIPTDIVRRMSDRARGIPDTDWHVAELYGFAQEFGASMITAKYSRYVIDLNRGPDDAPLYDQNSGTGLIPMQTFKGVDIYVEDVDVESEGRLERYWQPYHDRLDAQLEELRDRYGHALLWDAHSIPSRVPSLFEGELPILNIGTWNGRSCAPALSGAVVSAARSSPFETVVDQRFKGGYITRHYGRPEYGIHAIQMEIAQRAYMDERTLEFDEQRARKLRETLRTLLQAFLRAAAS